MAFAVTGAFKAIEHKADIVGIIILATITGVAGGTIRDVVLGKSEALMIYSNKQTNQKIIANKS